MPRSPAVRRALEGAGDARALATRIAAKVRRQGVVATVREVDEHLRLAASYGSKTHVWSLIDIAAPRPKPPLPAGLEFIQAGREHLPLLDELGRGGAHSRRRMDRGHALYLILDGDRPVLDCWAFHGEMPTFAARGGWLSLPAGVVNVEDIFTDPEYRGRGLAPAAYSLMFDDLLAHGVGLVVGKVPVDNFANRRALVKSGWDEFASVAVRWAGPWKRVRVLPTWNPSARWLAQGLHATSPGRFDLPQHLSHATASSSLGAPGAASSSPGGVGTEDGGD